MGIFNYYNFQTELLEGYQAGEGLAKRHLKILSLRFKSVHEKHLPFFQELNQSSWAVLPHSMSSAHFPQMLYEGPGELSHLILSIIHVSSWAQEEIQLSWSTTASLYDVMKFLMKPSQGLAVGCLQKEDQAFAPSQKRELLRCFLVPN